MDWLNYHHLLYFWTVAHEGSIVRAAKVLRLASPTVHAQIRTLEQNLGQTLLVRRGRGLKVTEAGQVVLGYADEIFSLGRELVTAVKQQQPAADRPLRFNVGVVDSVPKLVAKELLKPALHLDPPAHLVVREGKLDQLVAELAPHRLDMVLAAHPYNAPSTIRIFHHRLGECGVTFFARGPLSAKLKKKFPQSLDGAPALLPTENTAMRSSLESWFESVGVRPRVLAEFEDSALLKVFGSDETGFFAMPSIGVDALARSHSVRVIGATEDCRERFFALSAERRLKHPAVIAISQTARNDLFGGTG
ncbi:MAG: transcriptional activator NhaR [Myxococcales bacterium]|nr:transcriptional activator NhaR [Myxococcales bacterium]